MHKPLLLIVSALPLLAQTPDAKILGLAEKAVYDGDRISQLAITAALDVRTPGTYHLAVDLTAANGKHVTGWGRGPLEAGARTLTATIFANDIDTGLAGDGPYRISRARLTLDGVRQDVADVAVAIATAAYKLADLKRDLYSFTGEVQAAGIDPTPEGKFRALRVTVGVITPGGFCALGGELSNPNAGPFDSEIELQNGYLAEPVPPGKGAVTVDFQGAKIARSGANGSLSVSDLRLSCDRKYTSENSLVEDRQKHRIAPFLASDFDNPEPNFEFIPPSELHVTLGYSAYPKVGINASPKIRIIGALKEPIQLAASSDAPIEAHVFEIWTGASASVWQEGESMELALSAPADLAVGDYKIRIAGKAAGKEHTLEYTVHIDPDLSQTKQRRADALPALLREDAEPAPPDAASLAPATGGPRPAVTFKAEVALQKMHAVLVLDRSTSMFEDCDFLRAAATRFSRLFVAERDLVGVVDYGLSIDNALPLTDHFQDDAPDRISKIQCQGATNTGEALEAARKELAEHEDPEAMDAVILFTDGVPNVLTAEWPIKTSPACHGTLGPCGLGEVRRICDEGKRGMLAGSLVAWVGVPAFEPPNLSLDDEVHREYAKNRKDSSCFGSGIGDLAYIPEQDLHGIPVAGSHALERYQAGPLAGKIRVDSPETILNAIANQVENEAQRLRTGTPKPALVYVVGFRNQVARDAITSLESLQVLANDPGGPSFQADQPAGLAILTYEPEEFWPAFQRVREDLVRHATLDKK